MFPLRSGLMAGQHYPWATLGFILTGVCLPLAGLLASILFNGDYERFFKRLGTIPGTALTIFAMLIIGPMIAMPRIVTLSYVMIQPFMPEIPLFLFSFIFITFTFFATYKESKIINVLGYFISPTLIGALLIIIGKGIFSGEATTESVQTAFQSFAQSFTYGYQTLDVLAGIMFGSIVLSVLKKDSEEKHIAVTNQELASKALKGGILGISILGAIYAGMVYIGAYFGHGFEQLNDGELFSAISFHILGTHGAAVIAIAVLMACYSTIIALGPIFAEYITRTVFHEKISYLNALLLTLGVTIITSNFGLAGILKFSGPIIDMTYPAIIVLTLLNIMYALFDFKPVKLLVFATLASSVAHYWFY